jgi:hypothetical protein
MEAVIEKIMATNDTEELMDLFCWIIDGSYGVPTLKGVFMKSPEILAEFKSTQAYSDLYMELATDTDAALAFLKGIMPADIASKITDGKVQNMDDLRAMVQDHKAPQK